MNNHPAVIVVVGAGFSGVMTAVHLLSRAKYPTRVVLVNRTGRTARGAAYGTRSELHLLNVPAGRMSAFPDRPDDFVEFCHGHGRAISGGDFAPRSVYGQYLDFVLQRAVQAAPPFVQLEQLIDEVTDAAPHGAGVRVSLRNGAPFDANCLVLALGNYAPANPRIPTPAFFRSPLYVRDPWAPGALASLAEARSVLLIGTGLTSVDVALDLSQRGRPEQILAVSRRGLLSQPHRAPHGPPTREHVPPDLLSGPATALGYLRSVRGHIRRLESQKIDWRDVINALRPITTDLWKALPEPERRRFLRHLRPYWDVHRHRVAPRPHAEFDELRQRGVLSVAAGRLLEFRDEGKLARVRLQRRGQPDIETLHFDRVVNCTGPCSDVRELDDALLQSLLQRGLIAPDNLGLGLLVEPDGRLLRPNGVANNLLFLVGPLSRAVYWESTAVPELREQATRVAGHVLTRAIS